MADIREVPRTTTDSAATTATVADDDAPQVEVYDNDKPNTTTIMYDEDRTLGTTTYDTSTRTEIQPTEPSPNWGVIIVGILVVVVLILLIWLF